MTTLRIAAQQALEALGLWATGRDMEAVALNDLIHCLEAALAEPVQEPVATFDEVWDAIDWDRWRMEPIRELVRMIHSKTTPPQRKPLTDEKLDELAMDEDGLPNSHIEFARAIERAHGIE